MDAELHQKLLVLCDQAAAAEDLGHLQRLTQEINALLVAKQMFLHGRQRASMKS